MMAGVCALSILALFFILCALLVSQQTYAFGLLVLFPLLFRWMTRHI